MGSNDKEGRDYMGTGDITMLNENIRRASVMDRNHYGMSIYADLYLVKYANLDIKQI